MKTPAILRITARCARFFFFIFGAILRRLLALTFSEKAPSPPGCGRVAPANRRRLPADSCVETSDLRSLARPGAARGESSQLPRHHPARRIAAVCVRVEE